MDTDKECSTRRLRSFLGVVRSEEAFAKQRRLDSLILVEMDSAEGTFYLWGIFE